MENKLLVAWIGAAALAVFGATLLRYAPKLHRSFVEQLDRSSSLVRTLPLDVFVRSSSYPYILRIIGVMCLIGAGAMLWIAYR